MVVVGVNGVGGDVLDLCDLLQGEFVGFGNVVGNLVDYLYFEIMGGDNWVYVSYMGGFGVDFYVVGVSYLVLVEIQQIILEGVNLQMLYFGVVMDQQIIMQLLNNSKLIVD